MKVKFKNCIKFIVNKMSLLNSWSNQYIEAGCDEVGRGCLWY